MLVAMVLGAFVWQGPLGNSDYPWLEQAPGETLADRIPPPEGYRRADVAAGSFAAWLRGLPLKPGRPPVLLYDGRPKGNQQAHHAVVDIDTGSGNLQQCADAVMRLRAEYLFASGHQDQIQFNFTSGDAARWRDWRAGQRPQVSGNKVRWQSTTAIDGSYRNFRRYLRAVFAYAGTWSLKREMKAVADISDIRPGDVFIQGGFPGHAVLVADVAVDARGDKVFLLVQSYMPAQQIHLLRNPGDRASSPWYPARAMGKLETPEWRFEYTDLMRW